MSSSCVWRRSAATRRHADQKVPVNRDVLVGAFRRCAMVFMSSCLENGLMAIPYSVDFNAPQLKNIDGMGP